MRIQKEAIQQLYQSERVVSQYEASRFSSFQGKLSTVMELEIANAALKMKRPDRLLEIATGTGRVTRHLKHFRRGIGVDSSAQMLGELQRHFHSAKWAFKQDDALHLSFKNSSFDAVVTFRLIRHFIPEYRRQCYKEIHRVLKPGGILVFDALNRNRGAMGMIVDGVTWLVARAKGFKQGIFDVYFSKKELVQELEENKFEVVSMQGVLNHYPTWCFLSVLDKLPFLKYVTKPLFQGALRQDQKERNAAKPYSWVVVARKK